MLYAERCLPGAIDLLTIGPRHLALWAEGMRRGLAARAEIGEHRFIDVMNDDVVKRPLETFARIYDFLGMPVTAELQTNLQDYNCRNAPGKFGSHAYTPEQNGLTEAAIRKAFGAYIERFGL
jgi:hypothetical protein